MRLVSVSEISFMMSTGTFKDNVNPEDIQMGFSSHIRPEVNTDCFTLDFGVRYEMLCKVVLESVYRFAFEVKDLKRFIIFNDNKSITVNHIMPHFLSVAVGTMRGVLVVKTAGTNLSKYPLPMIDVNLLNASLGSGENGDGPHFP